MIRLHLLRTITLCTLLCGSCFADVTWIQPQSTSSDASLRGIAAVNADEAWVSGSEGTVLHTINAGQTWNKVEIPDDGGVAVNQLDFRDIALPAPDVVLLMAAGPGSKSCIFRSVDNGQTWTTSLINRNPKGFYNAIEMIDAKNGLLIGDPIDQRLDLYRTIDGGQSWTREVGPEMAVGEYGFAASGTNIAAIDSAIWIATGGSNARVIHSSDNGQTWLTQRTPIVKGNESSGIFSVAFRDQHHGVIVGGDYKNPDVDGGNLARTSDGGATWTLAKPLAKIPHKACVRYITGKSWVTVGRTGVAISRDDGATWKSVTTQSFYTLDVAPDSTIGWMAGSGGRVARFNVPSEQ